jgi:hypothetical protein
MNALRKGFFIISSSNRSLARTSSLFTINNCCQYSILASSLGRTSKLSISQGILKGYHRRVLDSQVINPTTGIGCPGKNSCSSTSCTALSKHLPISRAFHRSTEVNMPPPANQRPDDSPAGKIDELIKNNSVMVFSKTYCPFCKKVCFISLVFALY